MKRLFVLSLLLGIIFWGLEASADAVNIRNAKDVTQTTAIGHPTLGYSLTIDSEGRAYTRDVGGHTIASQWGSGLVYTGECVVHQVLVQGQTAADYAEVYDRLTAGDQSNVKADPQSATAKQIANADLKGSLFSTGIYIVATDGDVLVTVVYDPL